MEPPNQGSEERRRRPLQVYDQHQSRQVQGNHSSSQRFFQVFYDFPDGVKRVGDIFLFTAETWSPFHGRVYLLVELSHHLHSLFGMVINQWSLKRLSFHRQRHFHWRRNTRLRRCSEEINPTLVTASRDEWQAQCDCSMMSSFLLFLVPFSSLKLSSTRATKASCF